MTNVDPSRNSDNKPRVHATGVSMSDMPAQIPLDGEGVAVIIRRGMRPQENHERNDSR